MEEVMSEKQKIQNMTEETVVAYFDLEFCNEHTSHHNVPVSIGISYRQGAKEIGNYHTVIRCGDEMDLWLEQLKAIGLSREIIKNSGKSMEQVTEEILSAHACYQPQMYISFGRQDEELLKKYATEKLTGWSFCDACQFLPKRLDMKYDISLEKYAYICGLEFVHNFDPLADAKILGDILWCVFNHRADEKRRQEVAAEYHRKMFLIQYHNKQQAYNYLSALPELTTRQKEKLQNHAAFLKKNEKQYIAYVEDE